MPKHNIYIHTTKYFVFVLSAFIGGIAIGFLGIQMSFAQNSVYEPLRYFSTILHLIETEGFQDISKEELMDGAIKGMVDKLDKHSRYFPPHEYQNLKQVWNVGLGFQLTQNCMIIDISQGSPAEIVGLENGQQIHTMNNSDCIQMSKEERNALLYSEKGTMVTVQIQENPTQENSTQEIKIVSDDFLPPKIKWFSIEHGYLYVHIPQFHLGLCNEIKEIVDQNTVYGMLIDLRSNGGGYIDEGICLVDLFLEEGVITKLIDGKGNIEETHTAKTEPFYDISLMILVDSDTASAAELFSGVLQHYKRATLVGEPTYGKSSMQKVYQMENKSVLKLTIARYSIGTDRLIDHDNSIIPDHRIHIIHPRVQEITKKLSEHIDAYTLHKVQRSLESLYVPQRGNIQRITWEQNLELDEQLEMGWNLLKKE